MNSTLTVDVGGSITLQGSNGMPGDGSNGSSQILAAGNIDLTATETMFFNGRNFSKHTGHYQNNRRRKYYSFCKRNNQHHRRYLFGRILSSQYFDKVPGGAISLTGSEVTLTEGSGLISTVNVITGYASGQGNIVVTSTGGSSNNWSCHRERYRGGGSITLTSNSDDVTLQNTSVGAKGVSGSNTIELIAGDLSAITLTNTQLETLGGVIELNAAGRVIMGVQSHSQIVPYLQ